MSADLGAEGAQRLGDRLEEGLAAGGAVAAAAGGEADRAAAREERAARVARLGADRGLDEPVDDAVRAVVDAHVEPGHLTAVDPGGGAGARDGLADRRVGGAGDGLAAAVVEVDLARVGDIGAVLDEPVVVAGELRARVAAERVAVRVGPVVDRLGAVPGGEEGGLAADRHVEAERAAPARAGDRVAARDEGLEGALRLLERRRGAELLDGGGQLLELGALDGAVGGHDDLVGDRVHAPGGAGYRGGLLGDGGARRLQLGERVRDDSRLRARRLGRLRRRLVRHVDDEVLGLRVVVGARRVRAQVLGESRGELFGLRGREGVRGGGGRLRGVRGLEGESGREQRGHSGARDRGAPHGGPSFGHFTSSCGGLVPAVWGSRDRKAFAHGAAGREKPASVSPCAAHYSEGPQSHTRSISGRASEGNGRLRTGPAWLSSTPPRP
ncbi:putative secreted serine protease [Streptomyces sp. Tu6071]|nr:putative secreted serine protease [Streptomyces sp. Tu6071]